MSIIFEIIIWLIQLYDYFMVLFGIILDQTKIILSDIFFYSNVHIQILKQFLIAHFPWIMFLLLIRIFIKLVSGARTRKKGIIIVATILQMFIPDPYIERTVKIVQVQTKKQSSNEKQENHVDSEN